MSDENPNTIPSSSPVLAQILSAKGIPPGVASAIQQIAAAGGASGSFQVISGDELHGKRGLTPMTSEECKTVWLRKDWTPALGDIVVVRPEFSCALKYPDNGEMCVITQLIDPPIRQGDDGTTESAQRNDIALGFKSTNHGIDGHAHYHEHLFDSRMFVKVGQIDDPETT